MRFDVRQRMIQIRYFRRLSIVMVAVILVAVAAYYWHRGILYQDRFYSPNGRFYIQKYSTGGRFRVASVGGGSDMIDGYIRIYSSDDRLIHEHFQTFIRDIEPDWDERQVFFTGEKGVFSISLPEATGVTYGRTSRARATPTSRPVP
jgi:hypothetical protein